MKLTDYLLAQHQLISEQLVYVEEKRTSLPLQEAPVLKEMVLLIADALEGHAAVEDQFLFPALEPKLGKEMGPLSVMEFEHKEIDRILLSLRNASEPRAIRVEAAKFTVFLRDHIAKEETVLFPIAEEFLGEERLNRLWKEAVDSSLRKRLDSSERTPAQG